MLKPLDPSQHATPLCTLGCPVLDGFLRGGLPCGSITELTGEAAAGKSQIALQSLLTVQLPPNEGGLGGKAVYIYTEGKAPIERLQSVLANRYPGRADVSLDHVLVDERSVHSPDDLLRVVKQLATLLERQAADAEAADARRRQVQQQRQQRGQAAEADGVRQVRLLVIDSVAHVFRDAGEGDEPQLQQLQRRTAQLFGLSTLLKRMATQYQLAVLLTNQVSDDFNFDAAATEMGLPSTLRLRDPATGMGPGGSRAAPLVSSGRRVLPALGLAWANCINSRLFVARHDTFGGGMMRTVQVVFAPHLPHSFVCFYVAHDGVWGFDEEEEQEAPHEPAPAVVAAAAALLG